MQTKDMTTTQTIAPVAINGKPFTARHMTHATGGDDIILTGPRGAEYFLRGFLNRDDVHEVVSFKSGNEMRDKFGKKVRVVCIGEVIEQEVKA